MFGDYTINENGELLISGLIGGTGTANQVAYWVSATTLGGDAGFTYNAATDSVTAGDYFTTDGGQYGISGNELMTVNAAGNFTFSGITGLYVPDGTAYGISGNELLTVNAAGTFAFSNITGVTVEDADFIGNSAATARLGFDSSGATDYSYFLGCNVGVGIAAPGNSHLYVYDNALTSTSTFNGIYSYHIKTAGAGAAADDYHGIRSYMAINQATTVDNVFGAELRGVLITGTADIIIGSYNTATVDGGTVNLSVQGVQGLADVNAGTVSGTVAGIYSYVDIEAAATIGGNVYGAYVFVDDDAGAAGTVYMLYLNEASGINYGVFQNGTALNRFGGDTGIGLDAAYRLHVMESDAGTANTLDVFAIEHQTSGIAAANFGAGMLFRLEDTGGTVRDAARVAVLWQSAAAAENAEFQLLLNYDNTLQESIVIVAPNNSGFAGNQRGIGAVDLQGYRSTAATEVASGGFSTISGGSSNTASGIGSVVGGGVSNIASGDEACVPGGSSNTAQGDYSFSAGRRAKSGANDGCFVWGDSTNADVTADNADQFKARANGGVYFLNTNTAAALPLVTYDQADVDEPFHRFIGDAAAATLTRDLVDEGDVTTATRIGWYKIEIQDDGNQITDGDYYVPFYALA